MIIPWPVVSLIGAVASPFGFETYVRATGAPGWHWGRIGAEHVHFIRRAPGAKPIKALKPHKGGDRLTSA